MSMRELMVFVRYVHYNIKDWNLSIKDRKWEERNNILQKNIDIYAKVDFVTVYEVSDLKEKNILYMNNSQGKQN